MSGVGIRFSPFRCSRILGIHSVTVDIYSNSLVYMTPNLKPIAMRTAECVNAKCIKHISLVDNPCSNALNYPSQQGGTFESPKGPKAEENH